MQRLAGQVNCDQRRRACRIDCYRRTLEAECVGHPAGEDAPQHSGAQVAGDALWCLDHVGPIIVIHQARKDSCVAAAQRYGIDPPVLEGLPRRLQQQTLLRIHRDRLPGTDSKKVSVELPGVVEKASLARIAPSDVLRVSVINGTGTPAPIDGEGGDRVRTRSYELPQLVRRGHAAWI